MPVETEFYDRLGVSPNADENEIQRAYRKVRLGQDKIQCSVWIPLKPSLVSLAARDKISPRQKSWRR